MYKQLTIFQCPFCEIPYDNKFSRFNSNLNLCSADDEPPTVSAIQRYDDLLPITFADVDTSDQVQESFKCGCKHYQGKPCFLRFDKEEIESTRLQFLELTKEEMDIAITSHLCSCMHRGELTARSKKSGQSPRKAVRTDYLFGGFEVCRDFFLYVHGINTKAFKNTVKHFKECGVCVRVHKGSKKKKKHSLTFQNIQNIVTFILNFAEAHCIILPGRQPYGWKTDCKLLPTNCTKKHVHSLYMQTVTDEQSENRPVHYTTFCRLWNELTPFVTNLKPATDLCWYCQQRSVQLQRSVNQPMEKKSEAARQMMDHLNDATVERSLYNNVIDEAKSNLPEDIVEQRKLEAHQPNSFQGKNHYSFDFAQQVWDYGKGANTVISLLHFFFENYGLGETEVHLHADNCCGQNKTKYALIQYLL